jgi:alkylated DNA nucleotide flippase Atl1
MDNDIRLDSSYTRRIHAMVRQIPYGRVASYGQIARIVGGGYRPSGWLRAAGLKTARTSPGSAY